MKISYNWLMDYLPEPVTIDDLSNILTSIGLEVESIEKSEAIKGSLEGLIIGKVLTREKHPDADKLSLTTVELENGNIVPIVCGAPNVAAGQTVVVAPVGATVHPTSGAPFLIKKAKIRGYASEGMICAEDEIGLGKGHDGIMVLPEDAPAGKPAAAYFNVAAADRTISIGLTPNRTDAMSHIGVARDVCAYLNHHKGSSYTVQNPAIKSHESVASLPIEVTIEATEACPRYMGTCIKGVQVADSPEWLQLRLKAIGLRPVNNIVDITNFVLHEYGQPLHAFDYDKISGKQIIVKQLPEGTVFKTLDEKEIKLQSSDLMICDAAAGMCIAGVFGGFDSGISESTQNIFLESAYFDPKTIRRTSLFHGLRTDAATHFEKGVDIKLVPVALQRAVDLILEIAGGQLAAATTDIYPTTLPERRVNTTFSYINQLCGKAYSREAILTILKNLGFGIVSSDDTGFEVLVPTNKADVHQAADLAEEVLRIDGLDNINFSAQISMSLNTRPEPADRKWKEKIANHLCHMGLHEIVTNSITNSRYYPGNDHMVTMLNSLSSELDVMRPELMESGLEVLAYNINRKQQDLMLFELGNTYSQSEVGNYKQEAKLGIWLTGAYRNQQWLSKAEPQSIYIAKGIVSQLLAVSGIQKTKEHILDNGIEWVRGKEVLAKAIKIDPDKLKAFDIKQEVYYIEANMKAWTEAGDAAKVKYGELPKFPAVKRDLALVVDKTLSYSKIAAIAQQQKWPSFQDYELFDVFESEKIGADKKSLALSFTFQLSDRTMTDEEVDGMMQTLIKTFEKEIGASIRL
ncbi:MAG: phenylalanine--tRNA ligase subunit beta [Sphingobacteriales bacterium]|nr:MAG: phenylalanine--tRNA ligase subunit beta [Sphingobacteriales bacterium]